MPKVLDEVSKKAKKDRQRELRLKNFFNLSSSEYDLIFLSQGGVCAICRKPPKQVRLAIDHDHKTGLVRGLLCSICNRAIARFKDDLEKFKNCVAYFTLPPATKALGAPRFGLKGRVNNKASTRRRLNKPVAGDSGNK